MDSEQLKKAEEEAAEKPWILPDLVQSLAVPLAFGAAAIALYVLAGYALGHELMYRPGGGAATHPLTASTLLLIASGIIALRIKPTGNRLSFLILLAAAALLVGYVSDQVASTSFSPFITPFHDIVVEEVRLHKSNSMGWNSTLMLLLGVIAVLLRRCQKWNAAQIVAFIATAIPTTAITGYAYGLDDFYGEMSIYTALGGLLLCVAVLALTAQRGPVRAILSPYYGGRISRIQMLFASLLPGLLGYAMILFWHAENAVAVGAFVIANTWFSFIMVSISAVYLDISERSRRESERLLVQAAMHDQLTGLPNRRRFFQFGEYEIARGERTGKALWLLMLDLDSFKKVNDTAGHDMGDKVLSAVAHAMEDSVRSVDLACRLGGEEFAVLLVDSTREGASRVAEKIREKVASTGVPGWTDLHGPITVSIGGCEVNELGSLDWAIKAADKLLYEAKGHGKNRVVIG